MFFIVNILIHSFFVLLGGLFNNINILNLSEKNQSKHTCETAQLLKDIRGDHDSLCMCQVNEADFGKVWNLQKLKLCSVIKYFTLSVKEMIINTWQFF